MDWTEAKLAIEATQLPDAQKANASDLLTAADSLPIVLERGNLAERESAKLSLFIYLISLDEYDVVARSPHVLPHTCSSRAIETA